MRIGSLKLGMVLEITFRQIPGPAIQPLNSPLPICMIAVNRNETVAKVRDRMIGNQAWNIKFSRACNDQEIDVVVQLLNVIQKEKIISDGMDKVICRGAAGLFSL